VALEDDIEEDGERATDPIIIGRRVIFEHVPRLEYAPTGVGQELDAAFDDEAGRCRFTA
jgi:hypothetical protein